MRGFKVVVCAVLLLGSGCGSDGEPAGGTPASSVAIAAPANGSDVTSFEFDIEVTTQGSDIAPSSISGRLNDSPITFVVDDSRVRAHIVPGPPLRDDNHLTITASRTNGTTTTATSTFRYLPPKARAVRISREDQLIHGPTADSQIGDYLLENSVARFVVQDAPKRELANVATYGGNLIDAELINRPGRDNFLEIQPMVNIETVINAQSVEIVNDGQDGTPAIVRSCGPDDTLDFINPSSNIREMTGIEFPPSVDDADYDVDGCTDYVLEPAVARVEMVTTIFNNTSSDVGLFVGDFLGPAGSLAPWQVSRSKRNGIGEILILPVSALSLIGFGPSDGLDYQYVPVPLPGSPTSTSDVLAVAGVEVVLHSHSIVGALAGQPPNFVVPASGSRSYARYFGVGDGNGANAVELADEVMGVETGRLGGCVTVAGAPAPYARVAVGPASGGKIVDLASHFVTDERGCFEGTIAPGNYGAAAARVGTPFEAGGSTPLVRPFSIAAGESVDLQFDLPAPAKVQVAVRDENGKPLPARVTLVGFDPSPEPSLSTSIITGTATTYLFRDSGDEGKPFGIAELAYAGADGNVVIDAKPGDYEVAVSRGAEYSLFTQRVQLVGGQTQDIQARIAHVLDTEGFVSSDFHVHGINSTDSRTGNQRRVAQFAGEGVENIVMTDHHGRTDLRPTIEAMNLGDFVTATIGEEITSWEYGHYNGYPFDLVPGHQTGGSVDWARPAPPGEDFVSKGAYSGTPADIDALARSGPGHHASTIVQNNHVDSFYGPLKVDSSLVPPRSFLTDAEKLRFRLDPRTENLFHAFAAMEIINGDARVHQSRFFDNDMGIWFNLLNQGIITSGTGVTDTHGYSELNAAGARTWTASTATEPREIDPDQVTNAVTAGRASVGQGAFVAVELQADDGSGGVAGLRADQSTTVTSSNGSVTLKIRAQAPTWAEFDTIRVYANAATFPTGTSGGVNTFFSADPQVVLHAGDDFELERKVVASGIAGAERFEANATVSFPNLPGDTWFVVAVRGSDGISRPMFPVAPADLDRASNQTVDQLLDGNLGEHGVLAVAVSNPLYADVDGVPGFQAPLAPR